MQATQYNANSAGPIAATRGLYTQVNSLKKVAELVNNIGNSPLAQAEKISQLAQALHTSLPDKVFSTLMGLSLRQLSASNIEVKLLVPALAVLGSQVNHSVLNADPVQIIYDLSNNPQQLHSFEGSLRLALLRQHGNLVQLFERLDVKQIAVNTLGDKHVALLKLILVLAENGEELKALAKASHILLSQNHSFSICFSCLPDSTEEVAYEMLKFFFCLQSSFPIDIAKFKLPTDKRCALVRLKLEFFDTSGDDFWTDFNDQECLDILKVLSRTYAKDCPSAVDRSSIISFFQRMEKSIFSQKLKDELIVFCLKNFTELMLSHWQQFTASWSDQGRFALLLQADIMHSKEKCFAFIFAHMAEFTASPAERLTLYKLAAADSSTAPFVAKPLDHFAELSAAEKYYLALSCARVTDISAYISSYSFASQCAQRFRLALLNVQQGAGKNILENLEECGPPFPSWEFSHDPDDLDDLDDIIAPINRKPQEEKAGGFGRDFDFQQRWQLLLACGESCVSARDVWPMLQGFLPQCEHAAQLALLKVYGQYMGYTVFKYLVRHIQDYRGKYQQTVLDVVSVCLRSDYCPSFQDYLEISASFNFTVEQQKELLHILARSGRGGQVCACQAHVHSLFSSEELFAFMKICVRSSSFSLREIVKYPLDNKQMVELLKQAFSSFHDIYCIFDLFSKVRERFTAAEQFEIFTFIWEKSFECGNYNLRDKQNKMLIEDQLPFLPEHYFALAKIGAQLSPEDALDNQLLKKKLAAEEQRHIDMLVLHQSSLGNVISKLELSQPAFGLFLAAATNPQAQEQHISFLVNKLNLTNTTFQPSCEFKKIEQDLQRAVNKEMHKYYHQQLSIFANKSLFILNYFEPFFAETFLDSFSKAHIQVAPTLSKLLMAALHTPNQQIKQDLLYVVLLPFVTAAEVGPKGIEELKKPFVRLLRNAPTDTLAIHSYLFGLFYHIAPKASAVHPSAAKSHNENIYTFADRYDKLFHSLAKEGRKKLQQSMLDLLQALHSSCQLSSEQKWQLLLQCAFAQKQLSSSQQLDLLCSQLAYARIIATEAMFESFFAAGLDLKSFIFQQIGHFLPSLQQQQCELVAQFWLEKRTAQPFFSYCHSIHSTPGEEKQPLLTYFEQFAVAVASGPEQYSYWRYQQAIDTSLQLQKMAQFPALLLAWQKELLVEIAAQTANNDSSTELNPAGYVAIFQQAITIHDHLAAVAGLDQLRHYLQQPDLDPEEMEEEAMAEQSLSSGASAATLFQAKAIEFLQKCRDKQLKEPAEIKIYLESLKNLLSQMAPQAEFLNDLNGLLNALHPRHTAGPMKLRFTALPIPIFLCGTEVCHSCQRTDGDPHLNKCLMGYSSAHVAMVALESEQLVARAMLKLLFLEQENERGEVAHQPVLFLETPYPPSLGDKQILLLMHMAQMKAELLGLKLTACEACYLKKTEPVGLPLQLHCYGSSAPYEYSDANHSAMEKGRYTIFNAQEITGRLSPPF